MGWADPFLPEKNHPEILFDIIKEEVDNPISFHYTAPIGNSKLKEKNCSKVGKEE